MINFSAFEHAHQKYSTKEMPFLSELHKTAQNNKIYKGLKILHNIPLTLEAVLKIETLLLGGADVTASCITILPPNKEAVNILQAANVNLQLEHNFKDTYDFYLDCCAELINITPPKIGAVELTQSGSALYKKSQYSYPLISVDDSELKLLETIFGTGNGFVRALIERNEEVYNKKFVIFGYGKVGRGIVHSLLKFTDDIVVIDICQESMKTALKKGIKYIDSKAIEKIKHEIATSSFVVTATGVKNLLTDFYAFKKSDFGKAHLINMGAYDEYGKNFNKNEVLFEKKPFNFSIQEPTTMKYLDPILYAHNLGIDIILSGKVNAGYNPFPSESAKDILKKWSKFHEENSFDIEKYFY